MYTGKFYNSARGYVLEELPTIPFQKMEVKEVKDSDTGCKYFAHCRDCEYPDCKLGKTHVRDYEEYLENQKVYRDRKRAEKLEVKSV